jgi:hypothetical protein
MNEQQMIMGGLRLVQAPHLNCQNLNPQGHLVILFSCLLQTSLK